jgi:hypothetical protein
MIFKRSANIVETLPLSRSLYAMLISNNIAESLGIGYNRNAFANQPQT